MHDGRGVSEMCFRENEYYSTCQVNRRFSFTALASDKAYFDPHQKDNPQLMRANYREPEPKDGDTADRNVVADKPRGRNVVR